MAAIYMWFEGGVEYMVLTTTLYPLEAREGLTFTIDLGTSTLTPLDQDDIELGVELQALTLTQVLLSAPEQNDDIELGVELPALTLTQVLLSAPEQSDDTELGVELLDLNVEQKLVTIYHPDHGLIMDVDLNSSNCYMTAV